MQKTDRPVVEQRKGADALEEGPEETNERGAIGEDIERHRRVLDKVPLSDVPAHETDAADDERSDNVRVRPWVLLATPNQSDDEKRDGRDEDHVAVPAAKV